MYLPVWDQFQQSQFNWLWWECVTFQHYTEETSYENSLLVQQTGALALSSLTHVLRSLTPNARYRTHTDQTFNGSHIDVTSHVTMGIDCPPSQPAAS